MIAVLQWPFRDTGLTRSLLSRGEPGADARVIDGDLFLADRARGFTVVARPGEGDKSVGFFSPVDFRGRHTRLAPSDTRMGGTMHRRDFVAGSLGASIAPVLGQTSPGTAATTQGGTSMATPQILELRRYQFLMGPMGARHAEYAKTALVP